MNVREKLQALLTASNTTTGETDTTLTDAVQRLIDGYGGGGGLPDWISEVYTEKITPVGNTKLSSLTFRPNFSYDPNFFIVYAADWPQANYEYFGTRSIICCYAFTGETTTPNIHSFTMFRGFGTNGYNTGSNSVNSFSKDEINIVSTVFGGAECVLTAGKTYSVIIGRLVAL